jgi:outer membrane protein OmpA-like peptidoglycan-associated protein
MKLTFYFLLLFLSDSFLICAQNMIKNPDFSDVSIKYNYGKVVLPRTWDSFDKLNFPYFFSHPAKLTSQDFFGKAQYPGKYNGVLTINLLHQSNGFYTELKRTLEAGQAYNIEVELKFDRINLNSGYSINSYTASGEKIDSSEHDYNYIVSLITYFTTSNPDMQNHNERKIVIFDFPPNITPDSTDNWIKITKVYIADGNENYYSLGTYSPQDYIEILRTSKNDTTDYSHKWARCLLRKVNIVPKYLSMEYTINDAFDSISVIQTNNRNMKFVVRNINFDLDNFDLKGSDKKETDKVAEFLKNNTNINVNIIGHTDTIGSTKYNQILSEKRAFSIYTHLISQGVNKERLRYEGKGESEPL